MKFLIVVFGLLAWIGCHDESDDINEEVLAFMRKAYALGE